MLLLMKQYKMKDITRVLKIKATALQQWIDRGYVAPSIKGSGPGTRNIWSLEDIFSLGIFKELLKSGFSRDEAADFIKEKEIITALSENAEYVKMPDVFWVSEVEMYENIMGSEIHAVQIYFEDGKGNNHTSNFLLESLPDHEGFSALNKAFCLLKEKIDLLGEFTINSTRMVNLTNVRKRIEEEI
jgi:DNA-binding transcriptional MerR regulator